MFDKIGNTILITGGAGFIGSHLAEELFRLGHDVIIIDNFNDYYNPKLKEKNIKIVTNTALKHNRKLKIYRGDIRDQELIELIFNENVINGVVALAANAGVRPSIENPKFYVDVNIVGLTIMLETIKKFKCNSFVFISSSSVYGNNKKVPFSEKDIVDNPISPYAATKKAGELLCHTYHALYDINIACLRYFTVYGPRQRPDLAINKFTNMMLEGTSIPMYGNGTTSRDYTYVTDIIDGTIRALDLVSDKNNKIYDIFNLGGGNPITLRDLINVISESVSITPKIDQLSMQAGDVNITYCDFSHAENILGYHPNIEIREGIRRFVEWYKNEKNN